MLKQLTFVIGLNAISNPVQRSSVSLLDEPFILAIKYPEDAQEILHVHPQVLML